MDLRKLKTLILPATLIGVFALGGWRHGLSELRAALRPKLIGALALSAAFIFVNWAIYVWAVAEHRVIEAALAYFLAPLVQAGLGVAFFKEKLSRWQGAALVCAGAGVFVQGLALGVLPWISITLCLTWSAYALVRKEVVAPAAAGLFVETALLAPLAIALLVLVTSAAAWWAIGRGPSEPTLRNGGSPPAQRRGDQGDLLMPQGDAQRKANRRLGLILASVALAFALGFIAKMTLFAG